MQPLIQLAKLIGITAGLLLLITGLLNTFPAPPETLARLVPTATPTPTATDTPTATTSPSPSPTLTLTATPRPPTATATPTTTATPRPTDTPTDTATVAATPSPTPTSTLIATGTATKPATPTSTLQPPTAVATETATATETNSLTSETSLTTTLSLTSTTPTLTATPAGPPTDTPTPTPTPTPVPRTVRADNAPDFTLAQPHLWFTRPYTDAFATWGSRFYPYGTNADGLYLWHHGLDIQNPTRTPIIAVGDGVVVFAGLDNRQIVGAQPDFYGRAVVIRHSRPFEYTNPSTGEALSQPVFSLYGHISQQLVKEGDSVSTGQPIALTGAAGIALGPHLHLEIRLGQNTYLSTQNPDLWIRPDPGYGLIAGRVIDAEGFYVPQQLLTLHRTETPTQFWRQTRTYPDRRYLPDPQLGETFSFSDVPVGNYILKTSFDGHNLTFPITVTNQELSFIRIEGKPARATPALTPTATPAEP